MARMRFRDWNGNFTHHKGILNRDTEDGRIIWIGICLLRGRINQRSDQRFKNSFIDSLQVCVSFQCYLPPDIHVELVNHTTLAKIRRINSFQSKYFGYMAYWLLCSSEVVTPSFSSSSSTVQIHACNSCPQVWVEQVKVTKFAFCKPSLSLPSLISISFATMYPPMTHCNEDKPTRQSGCPH